jgi:hypothetical protein
MEDCRTARQVGEWNPQGKRRDGRPVNTWKDGVRDSMQRGNLKDEECFDQELRRRKIVFGLRKTVYSQKNSYTYIYLYYKPPSSSRGKTMCSKSILKEKHLVLSGVLLSRFDWIW